MPTAEEVIESGRKRIRKHIDRFSRIGDEREQARELLEHAAGEELDDDDEVDARTIRRYDRLIERRTTGEPVPYIRGYEQFGDLRLHVKPGAFIPRDTTRFLAQQAASRVRGRKKPIAADLATGVGAVALAIARAVPSATVYGTDISEFAIGLAKKNARANGLRNARFAVGSMFEPLPKSLRGSLDVIASHPPYVASGEVEDLPAETMFEPTTTLTDSSPDGLRLVRLLVDEGRSWLKPGGWLCIEIAPDLARRVKSLMTAAGYRNVRSTRGFSDWTRVLVGKN